MKSQKPQTSKEWLNGYNAGCRIQHFEDTFEFEKIREQARADERAKIFSKINDILNAEDNLDVVRSIKVELKKLEGKHD